MSRPGSRHRRRRRRMGRPSSSTVARCLGDVAVGCVLTEIYGNVIGGSSGTAPLRSEFVGNTDRRISVSAGDTQWKHDVPWRGWRMV